MADRYLSFTATAPGRFLTARLGLPQPAALSRWTAERPSLEGHLLHLTAGGPSGLDLAPVLARTGLPTATETAGTTTGSTGGSTTGSTGPAAVVLDATGVRDVDTLAEVHAALHPVVRSVAASGRVVVLGAPLDTRDHHQAAVQQALEGFVRSLGKEIGRGRTVNLVRLSDASAAESTLRFLLSPKSAYVSGQVIGVGAAEGPTAPSTGPCPSPGAPRSSPAPPAASARPSRRHSPGTAPTSSYWTYRRPRRTPAGSPRGWAAAPSRSTSRPPTRASASPPNCPTGWTY